MNPANDSASSRFHTVLGKHLVKIHLSLICLLTLIVYQQVREHYFVWDTVPFVLQNPWIMDLTWSNLIAIFTEAYRANWQPVILLSHSLDFHLFGHDSGMHHLVNLAIHTANCLLLYFLTLRLLAIAINFSATNKLWIAFFTSLIFGIHPQHVESVAWVVERKDVLYSFFALSSLISYLKWQTEPTDFFWRKHAPFLLFLLAVMSKSMAVTLPLILILLDFYPLKRSDFTPRSLSKAVMEKWHYMGVSLFVGLVTLSTQSLAMPPTENLPGWAKMLNAVDNFWFYIAHYLVPVNLSPLYPYPDGETLTQFSFWFGGAFFLVSSLLLGMVTWRLGYRWPLVLLGYYIITLLPVSGLIHVGPAKATDHYTYLATIPLGFLTGLCIVYAIQTYPKVRSITFSIAIAYCLFLSLLTIQQVTYWNNPQALWTRVVQLHPDSSLGHRNLASAYYSIGEKENALRHARKSVRLGGSAEDYVQRLELEMSSGSELDN
jgi:hypothetical protein